MRLIKQTLLISSFALASLASAAPYDWANWTSAVPGLPGSAVGVFNMSGGPVGVSYSGDLPFAQTNGIGTNYWIPPADFIGSQVSNGPGTSDTLSWGQGTLVNTITFASPVLNPAMAFWDVGSQGQIVVANFINANFTIDAQGQGYFGVGSGPWLIQPNSNTLEGYLSGSGTIYFSGYYNSISFVTPVTSPSLTGFTVGIEDPGAVPEPASWLALGAGLLPLWLRRRKIAQ